MRLSARPSRMRSFRRHAFSIFFAVVMIPGLLLGVALSADAARIILAHHQAGNVADVVAMAGATGIDISNESLDTSVSGLAATRARAMFANAQRTGMLGNQAASLQVASLTPTQITVAVQYTVTDLIVFGYFGAERSISGSASRSAGICRSGIDAASCAYIGS